MTNYEISTQSLGRIGLVERIARVFWGMAALFVALHFSIVGEDAYPLTTAIAAAVVLSGIVGWDPLMGVTRFVIERFRSVMDDPISASLVRK